MSQAVKLITILRARAIQHVTYFNQLKITEPLLEFHLEKTLPYVFSFFLITAKTKKTSQFHLQTPKFASFVTQWMHGA